MKRAIKYLAFLLAAFFPWAHASQAPAVQADAPPPQGDCRQMSDNRVVNASTSLRVTVFSCSSGMRMVIDRKVGNVSAETASKIFNMPNTSVNAVVAVSEDAFDINFLESSSYTHPSVLIYSFHFQDNQWLLREMSFQATQSCNGEAGVEANYYDVDYLAGTVEAKMYDGCDHYRKKEAAMKPAFILLENFDPSDERLSPFHYE
ncbi:hypothetical protein [Dyella japonica]|uniref:Uncharacterized protein n=1 Tax=Dyella japonica A8 TaxID=1217721 RepID=A0A075JVK9_9GAMM|nr:hypothetical protein [Dyella japonica]AIF45964.1 hypothetical protein HY57_01120 [Dyella japonica A8]